MLRALAIGIDEYNDAPLEGCMLDAHRMYAVLAKNDDGSRNFDCRIFTAPQDQITTPFLRESVSQLFEQPADAALFYFAGHGTHDALDGFLVTQDLEGYNLYAMRELFELATAATHIKEIVLILDCCSSGRLGERPASGSPHVNLREGLSVMTATRSTETSAETSGGGLFTSLVIAALEGGAADIMGRVTVPSVYAYVDQAMSAWQQRPLLRAHVSHLMPLRRCRPSVELDDLQLMATLFAQPGDELPLDETYEPTEDPVGHPNERIFRSLQRMRDARLLVPVGEDHLYYAAINKRSCRLTPSGRFYWQLVRENRL